MHGTLRFILALMVALSHLGILHPDFNQGVFAVVVFYLLAGAVSYKLLTIHYPGQALAYYKDRLNRIYPFYLFALGIASIAYLLGASSFFISKQPQLIDILSNLSIIPLSYYMYTGQDRFTLLPPAWSLGVELQCYLLMPFLLKSPRLFTAVLLGSLGIFSLASVGILDTNLFGYRLLAGVIFIFLLGVLIQKSKQHDPSAKQTLCLVYLLLLGLFAYILQVHYKASYNYETLSALLIALPALSLIKLNIHYPPRLDKYLGELSYGIFLLHFPALWLWQGDARANPPLILITSLLLAIIGQYLISHRRTRSLKRADR